MHLFQERKSVQTAGADVLASEPSHHQHAFAVSKRPSQQFPVKQSSLLTSSFTKDKSPLRNVAEGRSFARFLLKGLSSLGRKVVKKWERLKRSRIRADLAEATEQEVQVQKSTSEAKAQPEKLMEEYISEDGTQKPKLTYEELEREWKLLLAQFIRESSKFHKNIAKFDAVAAVSAKKPPVVENFKCKKCETAVTKENPDDMIDWIKDRNCGKKFTYEELECKKLCLTEAIREFTRGNRRLAMVNVVVDDSKDKKCEAEVTTKFPDDVTDLLELTQRGHSISGGTSGCNADSARVSQSLWTKAVDSAEYEGNNEIQDANKAKEPTPRSAKIVVEVIAKDEDLGDALPVDRLTLIEDECQPIKPMEKSKSKSELPKIARSRKSCEIIGALTKDGRMISASEMSFEEKKQSFRRQSKSTACNFGISKLTSLS